MEEKKNYSIFTSVYLFSFKQNFNKYHDNLIYLQNRFNKPQHQNATPTFS